MNQDNQQLTSGYDILLAQDQPLSRKEMREVIMGKLGTQCEYTEVEGKKRIVYHNGSKDIIIFAKAITYLGNPHPIFKKRIQIPKYWIEDAVSLSKLGYDVRFIGVYHFEGFIIFADFVKDSYIQHQCNNSAAHIYINDLYQGDLYDYFSKIDQNGNEIRTISNRKFAQYLQGEMAESNLFKLFAQFNYGFCFGEWLTAIDAIQEMHQKHWSQWRQAEWAGWFLEYRFSHFTEKDEIHPYIQYTALTHKGSHDPDVFDFDIWFPAHRFYGDLKASDKSKKETPGNDQIAFVECLKKFGKFWYVIYEHETIKDSDKDFEATLFRNNYLKEIDNVPDSSFDPMSYHQRMKHSVKFTDMCILEINRINLHSILSDFNQGCQPDGNPRNPKFKINKKDIDNFVIYRYHHKDEQ
ncbi:MAG: hypothetical protein LIP03_13595 [Bacteroidales bacterium]|nr:hypothetical protein [Bacteroidales bacterium]